MECNRLAFIKALFITPVAVLLNGCEKGHKIKYSDKFLNGRKKDDKYAYFYLSPDKKDNGGIYKLRGEDVRTFLRCCQWTPRLRQITLQEFENKKPEFAHELVMFLYPYKDENKVEIYSV
jgi:hypothetical protein